jgi:hypothetical protein
MSADESERAMQGSGILGKGVGNGTPALEAQAVADGIVQGSQDRRRMARVHMAGILLVSHIPPIMDSTLHRPMGPPQRRQRMGL